MFLVQEVLGCPLSSDVSGKLYQPSLLIKLSLKFYMKLLFNEAPFLFLALELNGNFPALDFVFSHVQNNIQNYSSRH